MSEFRSIGEVLNEVDRWDGQIARPVYDTDGAEKFSSKLRRATQAFAETERFEAENPDAKAARLKRMADNEAADIERGKTKAEEDFWGAMPSALRAMGLAGQELNDMAGMDLSWPGPKAVEAWMAGPKLFLTLGGPTNSGKTLAASSCLLKAWEWVESQSYAGKQWRTRWGRFVKANEIAKLSYFDKSHKVYLDRLKVTRWLIIDDLGTEAAYDTWRATLMDLIDDRARNCRRTIITTNLTGPALQEAYDARVWRRLRDFGEFVAVKRPEATQKWAPDEAVTEPGRTARRP